MSKKTNLLIWSWRIIVYPRVGKSYFDKKADAHLISFRQEITLLPFMRLSLQHFAPGSGSIGNDNMPGARSSRKDNSWSRFQTVGLLSAATSLIYRLCHVMRDHSSALLYILPPHIVQFCVSRSIVEQTHFRDADNKRWCSFQGRESLPLIEDSPQPVFRVKVQKEE